MNESLTVKAVVGHVDDDENVCRSMERLLRSVGMRSVSYSSAERLLADRTRPQFDCLLLDIKLGGMSGIELNQQLALSGSTTPVIFLTAHEEAELREAALRTPCIACLKKTEREEVLLAAIRDAIELTVAGVDGHTPEP